MDADDRYRRAEKKAMYIVQEIQTFVNGATALLPAVTKEDLQEAESVFHQKLAYAATSELPVHAVVIFDETGALKKRECYYHYSDPVDEPVDESGNELENQPVEEPVDPTS